MTIEWTFPASVPVPTSLPNMNYMTFVPILCLKSMKFSWSIFGCHMQTSLHLLSHLGFLFWKYSHLLEHSLQLISRTTHPPSFLATSQPAPTLLPSSEVGRTPSSVLKTSLSMFHTDPTQAPPSLNCHLHAPKHVPSLTLPAKL